MKPKNEMKPDDLPESDLQAYTDQYLGAHHIEFFRIPDQFWKFLHACNASTWLKKWFAYMFGGMADNTCFIPISDKYSLCMHLELKSKKGQLHGRQKVQARKLPWQIARSQAEVEKIVQRFVADAESIQI